MSSKGTTKGKKTNASSDNGDTNSVKKVKIPKQFVVRPHANGAKAVVKVYLQPAILEGLDFKSGDLVYINKADSGDPGVVATAHMDPEILDSNIITVSSGLRKLSGLLLGDRVQVVKYLKQQKYTTSTIVSVSKETINEFAEDEIAKKVGKVFGDVGLIAPGLQLTIDIGEVSIPITVIDVNPNTLDESMENLSINNENQNQNQSETVTPVFIFNKGQSQITITSDLHVDTKKYPHYHVPSSFNSIGGLSKQISLLQSTIQVPLYNPELFSDFGISPPRGILLHGPPGTGKTMLLRCVAQNIDAHVLSINGPSIVSKYLGETENAIREIFIEARKFQPAIVFMDEVDSIVPSRTSDDSGETESRVVATMLTMMDGMNDNGRVVVVGATNRPNSIDSALRRPGRFDQEVEIGIPDANDRYEILNKLIKQMKQNKHQISDDDIKNVSSKTHGYVGADLVALCRESVMKAINKGVKADIPQADIKLCLDDMLESLPEVRPSAMREIFLEMPKVYWSDIGGQKELKAKLTEVVQLPLEAAETFAKLGVLAPKGVLLYGPPGCSKTLTAKALATESGLNFLAVKGPEILNKYVGESERTIREIFRKARAASPSIIFFDEIDAISGDRDGTNASQNVLTSLLNEIDGVEELKGVVIVAATNKPTEIDPALLRPGRLDRHIYVAPPDYEARLEILSNCCGKFNLDTKEVDYNDLARATEGCSGAEVSLLCQESGLAAIMENKSATSVHKRHFDHALAGISKGITTEMLDYYQEFAERIGLSV